MTTNIMCLENNKIVSADTNYQGFIYNISENICIPKNHRVIPKWGALSEIFPDLIKGKSFMDLGANMGFFCFKALEYKATKVYGIESNNLYYDSVSNVIKDLEKMIWVYGRFPIIVKEKKIKADVVMCLSLIHHLFAKYALEEIVKDLYEVTNQYVIAEWVDVGDASVQKYGHSNKKEYERKFFEKKVLEYFSNMEFIGEGHHSTRFIYLLKR